MLNFANSIKDMRIIVYIFFAFTILSCGEYQKALNGDEVSVKFNLGTSLFEEGKFSKANRLFAQIVPRYRGKPQAQKLMYMYTRTFYETRDYYTTNYQAERFVNSYPNSEKLEEIAFIGAKSYYYMSPIYSKDQSETKIAIDKLQLFINAFPESSYNEEINKLIFELDYKLEFKSYSKALQYNILTDYQASIKAFDNFIIEFPGTSLREKALYYKFDSAYKLAVNSVTWKMDDRVSKAITYYKYFVKNYKESTFIEDIELKYKELIKLKTI